MICLNETRGVLGRSHRPPAPGRPNGATPRLSSGARPAAAAPRARPRGLAYSAAHRPALECRGGGLGGQAARETRPARARATMAPAGGAARTMSSKGRSLAQIVRKGWDVAQAKGLTKWLPVSNRAQQGLFGGSDVRSGNKVSEDGGNKSRRKWYPNVQRKRLWSEELQESFQLKVTARVLKTIDKYGGLDAYLLNTSDRNLASLPGFALREELRTARALRAKHAQTAAAAASPGAQ